MQNNVSLKIGTLIVTMKSISEDVSIFLVINSEFHNRVIGICPCCLNKISIVL